MQSGTKTEEQAFADFKAFITNAHEDMLRAWLRRHPDLEATLLPRRTGRPDAGTQEAPPHPPDGLHAGVGAVRRPTPRHLAPADEKPKRPGPAARALLTAYVNVGTTKTGSRTALRNEREDITPAGLVLAEALWDVHCAARFHHRRRPEEASKYFDNAGVPTYLTRPTRKKSAKSKQ